MSRLIGYARVSTDDQNMGLQLDALEAFGCNPVFKDEGISGKYASRPGMDACLAALEPGDTLIVWKLDRLGRSLVNLIDIVNDLRKRGIGFRSLTQGEFDTTTSTGNLMFQIFAAFSEYERNVIVERTQAGLTAAKKRGAVLGRKRSLTAEQALSAAELVKTMPVAKVARTFQISRPTLYRALARANAIPAR